MTAEQARLMLAETPLQIIGMADVETAIIAA